MKNKGSPLRKKSNKDERIIHPSEKPEKSVTKKTKYPGKKKICNIEDISAPDDADWEKEWISATSTRNYILKDPLLDWLKLNFSTVGHKSPEHTKTIINSVSGTKSSSSFHNYIMEQGNIFESHVIRLLTEKLGKKNFTSIGGEMNPRSRNKVIETFDSMMKGVPVIHAGVLHHPKTKTYGIPDLLIRSDWINKVTKIDSLDESEMFIPAPSLRIIEQPEKIPRYHYIVVDIKFTTLYLRADGLHVLNCGSFPAYKSQLHIYNQALAEIQGYNPQKAYILGRKWKFISKGEIYKGKSCFDRLAKINYKGIDEMFISKTEKAINWIRDVKDPSSKDWNISHVPFSRPELYPNMCNTSDHPWHNLKQEIAKKIKELTSLWMVGVKNRKIAHGKGIYKWTDKKCTAESLGIMSEFNSRTLQKILDINQNDDKNVKVLPLNIENNLGGWQNPKKLEFYVDFETINDVVTDFEGLPNTEDKSIIFMIGVGHKGSETDRWNYKSFCVNNISFLEERRICQEFSEYILSESKIYKVKQPICIHWGHAESSHWDIAFDRHGEFMPQPDWVWVDLLKIFKKEPIVVKGSLGFGLKQISSALLENDCISSTWDSDSYCLDGRDAMIGAWKASKESKIRNIDMSETSYIRAITTYNRIDVKVICEIVKYLRENHIKKSSSRKRKRGEETLVVSSKCRKTTEMPIPRRSSRLVKA